MERSRPVGSEGQLGPEGWVEWGGVESKSQQRGRVGEWEGGSGLGLEGGGAHDGAQQPCGPGRVRRMGGSHLTREEFSEDGGGWVRRILAVFYYYCKYRTRA